jgi:[NiFe] hydrogenase diaphorase moiety small subunit
MSNKVKFKIDGKECVADEGQMLSDAAADNGIYIPTLCNLKGIDPCASCRVCTVRVGGRLATACTSPVGCGMEVEFNTPDLNDIRKAIIELLFVEGNHYCPTCEMSGRCELQALAYRFNMLVPRFPYNFPKRDVDASNPKLIIDYNRCVRCKRCIRSIKDENGRSYFAFYNRGDKIGVQLDKELGAGITDELAQKAMDNCPVGAILVKGRGFNEPIGKRKYDKEAIGSEIENQNT